jgi:predicted kinase
MSAWVRYFHPNVNQNDGGINPNEYEVAGGETVAESFGLGVDEKYHNNQQVVSKQQQLIYDVITGEKTKEEAKEALKASLPTSENTNIAKEENVEYLNEKSPITVKNSLTNEDVLSKAITLDAVLIKSNEYNTPPRKLRVFDFDDTLATTNSRVIYKKPNTTGKPQPKFKAVLMAGSPGAGKSTVIKNLGLEDQGYKIVNQDISLEWAKKLVGLSEAEGDYDAVERSKRSELGALAKKIAEGKLDKFTKAGNGVVIDGTGASLKATKAKIKALEDLGYDVKMIYVETSKEEAVKRNAARKERSLKDFIVEKSWDSVNKNKDKYKSLLGKDFFDLNTEGLEQGETPVEFSDKVNSNLNEFEKGRLSAGGFALVGAKLESEGATFDFREFNKVVDGKEGPLLDVAKKIQEVRGSEDIHVLTARAPEAAKAIQLFLASVGLNLDLKNITGLGDGNPQAKANWTVEKYVEGYNDFYFADDHGANVEAVRDALDQLPVKSKVQQAKPTTKFSFDTKRDLKWEPMGPPSERDGQKVQVVESTQWDIKGKKYGMYIERLFGEMLEMEISYLADKGLIGEKQGVDIQKLQEYILNEGMEDIN